MKQEKKIELLYKKEKEIRFIQRFWRGTKGRDAATLLRRTNASLIIQTYARRMLAIRKRKELKLQLCCTMVQACMRRILAKREAERLQRIKIAEAKLFVAIKLQCHFRRIKA